MSAIYDQLRDQFREAARGPQPRSVSITVHAQIPIHTHNHIQRVTHACSNNAGRLQYLQYISSQVLVGEWVWSEGGGGTLTD